MEENKFNFKFLNVMMYIFATVVIFFTLKEFGILSKIGDVLVALIPFYVGVVVCWISKPLANRIRKLGVSKGLSAIISLLIIFAIIVIALAYIIPLMVTQVTELVKDLPSIYTSAATKINEFIENRLDTSFRLSTKLEDFSLVLKYFNVENIVSYSINTVSALGSLLISFVTSVMISFFMVKDMDRTKNNIIVFISKNKKDSNTYKMLTEMDEIINSYFRGIIIDSVIVGILTTILCWILKFKYAVVFGIIIMFLNLIPYIGAAISYAIMTVYAFTVGGPITAIITLLCSFAIQLFDANILQPNIIAKSVNLHPVVVICGLLAFGELFGVVGMLIAMPVLAIGKIYIKYKFKIEFEQPEDKLKRKKLKKEREKEEIEG